MLTTADLIDEVKRLPVVEKWRLVKELIASLEQEQKHVAPQQDWHEFLRETYGMLQDTPIQRWDQGDYEEREPLG